MAHARASIGTVDYATAIVTGHDGHHKLTSDEGPELGGKDAMIVCADAPFERTVNGALWGAFSNCGQACASVERLYVVEAIADKFISAVAEKTKTLRVVGDGGQMDIGPLTNANQLRVVTEQVKNMQVVLEGLDTCVVEALPPRKQGTTTAF